MTIHATNLLYTWAQKCKLRWMSVSHWLLYSQNLLGRMMCRPHSPSRCGSKNKNPFPAGNEIPIIKSTSFFFNASAVPHHILIYTAHKNIKLLWKCKFLPPLVEFRPENMHTCLIYSNKSSRFPQLILWRWIFKVWSQKYHNRLLHLT